MLIPPNYAVMDLTTQQRYFMLIRPDEESTEMETYLNPLFENHPDLFLQPVDIASIYHDIEHQGKSTSLDEDLSLEYLIKSEDERAENSNQ